MSLVQLPSQRELDLQRQMAELQQELKALQNNPASQSQNSEGAQINLQVLYLVGPFYKTASTFEKY